MTCRAVLFDLDGVLADSTGVVDRVWRAWADERGLDGAAIMKTAHGRPAAEVIRAVAPHLSAEAEVELLEKREAGDSRVVAIAGSSEFVASLPRSSWAVVTSGTTPLASARLVAIGLPDPPVLITANDVDKGKPNPEGYLAAARRLGAAPRDCVVIEDSPAGIEAARAAGMAVIGVTTTYPAEELTGVDALVETLAAVTLGRANDKDDGPPELELIVGDPE
ncbi:MAG: HAD-IA family hydrolase [Actinomycetota bacterium]